MLKKVALWIVLGVVIAGGWGWLASVESSILAQDDTSPSPTPLADPTMDTLDLEAIAAIDLHAYPEVPVISEYAQQLYSDALASDSDPNSFIKVGDCMTDNPYFLRPIGKDDYALGEYDQLQHVIDQFSTAEHNAFSRVSMAAAGGFNTASILDSLWANPEFCESGETPLACEVRVMQPSITLMMFGTNDVFYLDEAQFDFFLRSIVVEAIRANTLPILSTFPHRPEFPEESVLYNQIVVQVAQDYDIPLINLWRALEPLPNQGVDPDDPTHLSAPTSGAVCHFIDENMQAGFTVRNLLTLETLDVVLNTAAVTETSD